MFDITKSRQIYYGEDQSVILFQDHTANETWYMVPVPRLRIANGQPTFSLTKYLSTSGDAAGLCTFQVELYFPEDARKAAEEQIGGTIIWGQFTWVGGETYFRFDIGGDAEMVAVSPTLFGSNVAGYQVELESESEVNDFINAFSGDGSLSPFRIDYEMIVLTDLLGAKATITYNSTAAIDYERKYETHRDTWGHTKQVLVEVKQVLKRSDAGTVNVERGAGGTDETVQRVRDWAWSTLEQEVAATVATAQAMATGPNPVSASTSFTRSYEENAIIEWTTPVTAYLPKFDAEIWKKVYTEVDNRELAVTFMLAGELFDEDGVPAFENVEVTVRYPTRTQDNTFSLVAGDNDKSVKTYIAPGDTPGGKFDPNYSYKYVVHYAKGAPYESSWIETNETHIELRPHDFGLTQVHFIGSNVPFKAGGPSGRPDEVVDKIFIDFFYLPPLGNEALVESKLMTMNGEENQVRFTSNFNEPVGQEYSFRLRYLMESGNIIVIQPESRFGGDNANVVQVLSPLDQITIFDLRAYNMDVKEGAAFDFIEVDARYYDVQNDGDKLLANHNWSWTPNPAVTMDTAPSWSFQVAPNPDTAYYKLTGQILFAGGENFPLTDYFAPASQHSLILYSDSYYYSVKIDTTQIDWVAVSAVYVNLFQYAVNAGSSLDELSELPPFYLKPRPLLTNAQRMEAEEKTVNLQNFHMIDAVPGEPTDDFTRYYNIRRRKSESQVVYFYGADYVMKDGTIKYLNSEMHDKLQIILPPVPVDGATPKVLMAVIPAGDLPGSESAR